MYNKEFDGELKLIQQPLIRSFVRECLDHTPSYFWAIPASSTGKHHPTDENVVGGAVLHTRRAVKIGEDLCRNFDITGDDRDCVIAALIMHDLNKSGLNGDPVDHTVAGHGGLWILMVSDFLTAKDFYADKNLREIARLISIHMGRWDSPFIIADDKLGLAVQLADYVSSREYISVIV